MSLKCGIVGLPNVGKSTFFNAISATQNAEASNYPFCTIEPNKAIIPIYDKRLDKLSSLANSKKTIYTDLELVDIAGLVKGASKGEGLGNQFLSHIRQVDAIVHLVRCFKDPDIVHVEGDVDPVRDLEIIISELILADLESIEKQIKNLEKKARSQDKESIKLLDLAKDVHGILSEGKMLYSINNQKEYLNSIKTFCLITSKPFFVVCNLSEQEIIDGNDLSKKVLYYSKSLGSNHVINISAKIEYEISQMDSTEEKDEFLRDLGIEESGLNKVIKTGYGLMDLHSYFTVGPKEARAWTIRKGDIASVAAGVIHSDFERGFIRAEVISFTDYLESGSESSAKDKGKMRLEGRNYVVQDGDVIHFRFNV